jgi:hypothetical protein
MLPRNPSPTPKTRLGCGFLFVSVLLTCVLLAINGLIVTNVYYASRPGLPDALQDMRVAQAVIFLGPVLLLLVEWWICDVALDWIRPQRQPVDKG